MVAEFVAEDYGALVVGIKVCVEDVCRDVIAGDGNDDCRCGSGDARRIWFCACEPGRRGCYILFRSEVDVEAFEPEGIEKIEIGEVKAYVGRDGGVVYGWLGVFDVREEGGWEVFFVFVKPDDGGWEGYC